MREAVECTGAARGESIGSVQLGGWTGQKMWIGRMLLGWYSWKAEWKMWKAIDEIVRSIFLPYCRNVIFYPLEIPGVNHQVVDASATTQYNWMICFCHGDILILPGGLETISATVIICCHTLMCCFLDSIVPYILLRCWVLYGFMTDFDRFKWF